MHFSYCPHCGAKLILREIGDEGMLPYCNHCQIPLWDMFTTSIICAVVNELGEIALLRQDYVSRTNYVCVAGIMKLGESAEETVRREVEEEIGLKIDGLEFVASYPYLKKEMLMLGFLAHVRKAPFLLSGEVDSAEWVSLDDAPGKLRQGGIAWELVNAVRRKYDLHCH